MRWLWGWWLVLAAGAVTLPGARGAVETFGNFHTLGVVLRPPPPLNADTCGEIRLYETSGPTARRLQNPVRVADFDYFAGSVFHLTPGTTTPYRADYYNLNGQLAASESFSGATRPEPGPLPEPLHQIYVANTGNDANPGTLGQPKRTIAAALAAITQPGTHVILRVGTYYESNLRPPALGTAQAPIVLRNYPNEAVAIDGSDPAMLSTGWTNLGGGYWRRAFTGQTWLVAFRSKTTGVTFRAYPVRTLTELNGRYSGVPANSFTKYNITAAYHCSGSQITIYCPAFTGSTGDIEMRVSVRDSAFNLNSRHHVAFQGLEIRYFQNQGIYVNESNDVRIRECQFAFINTPVAVKRASDRLLVEDNTFLDDCARWGFLPKSDEGYGYSAYIETGAVLVHWPYDGRGLVIRRNSIKGLFDGVHLVPTGASPIPDTSETDFYANTIHNACDDLMEIDGFARNVRVFGNSMSNYLAGVSLAQAVHGPTYILHNTFARHGNSTAITLSGFQGFPVKMNGGTDYGLTGQAFFYHNTIWTDVPNTPAWRVQYANWQRLTLANNIWQGTAEAWWNWQSFLDPVSMPRDLIYAPGTFLRINGVGSFGFNNLVSAPASFHFLTNAIPAAPRLVDPAAGDFTPGPGSPAIDAGVLLPGINDLAYSGSAPDLGAWELTGPATVGFRVNSSSIPESATEADIEVLLSRPVDETISVAYAVIGGTASNGLDYALDPGELVFPPQTTSRLLTVPLLPDDIPEGNETVILGLSSPTNALLGGLIQHVLTIIDDDQVIRYVDAAAAGANNGESWANAYTSLVQALAAPLPAVQYWVAAGRYTPGAAVTDSFTPPANARLYGGFAGHETRLDQRDLTNHLTVLCGDLAGNDGPDWNGRDDNARHVVSISSTRTNIVIDGFVIRGGHAGDGDVFSAVNQGGGLRADSTRQLTVRRCVFTDNSAAAGGGIYLRRSADVRVEDCDFVANRATEQGANRGSGAAGGEANAAGQDARFARCRFVGNTATGGRGGAVYTTTTGWEVDFDNCLFAGNQAGDLGGGLFLRSHPTLLRGCTFAGNVPEAIYIREGFPSMQGSIVWSNAAAIQIFGTSGAIAVSHSNVDTPGYDGNGNLRTPPQWRAVSHGHWASNAVFDPHRGTTRLTAAALNGSPATLSGLTLSGTTQSAPQFLVRGHTADTLEVWGDATALGQTGSAFQLHDYQLDGASPCVDAVPPPALPADDLLGVVRPQGFSADMGAYEFTGLRLAFTGEPREGVAPLRTVFAATLYGASYTNGFTYWWDFDGNGQPDAFGPDLAVVEHLYTQSGRYDVGLLVSNAQGEVAQVHKSGYVWASPTPLYVSLDGGHVWPFANWTDAATNLADALDAAAPGTTVLVSNGYYRLTASIPLNRALTVQSTAGAADTILDADGQFRIALLNHPAAVLAGFTLTGGQAADGGGVLIDAAGTVEDCIIVSNTATFHGGGIFLDGGGVVRGSRIHANTAGDDGGGVHAAGGGLIDDCDLVGNVCGDDGAGAYLTGAAHLRRSRVTGNHSGDDAGGVQCGDAGGILGGTVTDCLFVGNTANDKGGAGYIWNTGVMINSLAVSNRAAEGGGFYCRDGGTFLHVTVADNTATTFGGGLVYRNGGLSRNTIYYHNTAPADPDIGTAGGSHLFDRVCAPIALEGFGNLTADPAFAAWPEGDLRLSAASPAVDAGVVDPAAPDQDLDGVARPLDGTGNGQAHPDLGAYEFIHPTADTDGDGLPDAWEIAHGLDPRDGTGDHGPDGDPDGDGASHWEEFIANTDPHDPDSVLALTGLDITPDAWGLSWKGGTSAVQILEWGAMSVGTATVWEVLLTVPPPTLVHTSWWHQPATNAAVYRLRALPGP